MSIEEWMEDLLNPATIQRKAIPLRPGERAKGHPEAPAGFRLESDAELRERIKNGQ